MLFFRVTERNIYAYRKFWPVFLASFAEPVFYLFSLGLGLGQLINDININGQIVSYPAFVAPGLLATSAMTAGFYDMTFNFFYKFKYSESIQAMLNTPLSLNDVVLGETASAVLRAGIYSTGFLAVMAAFGLVDSWWSLMSIPAALLIGCCFAGMGALFSSSIKTWHDFDFIQLLIQPMFLCSATFFPVDVYPSWARPLVFFSPLYHGVALVRDLTLGSVGVHDLGHAAILAVVAIVTLKMAQRRLEHLLIS